MSGSSPGIETCQVCRCLRGRGQGEDLEGALPVENGRFEVNSEGRGCRQGPGRPLHLDLQAGAQLGPSFPPPLNFSQEAPGPPHLPAPPQPLHLHPSLFSFPGPPAPTPSGAIPRTGHSPHSHPTHELGLAWSGNWSQDPHSKGLQPTGPSSMAPTPMVSSGGEADTLGGGFCLPVRVGNRVGAKLDISWGAQHPQQQRSQGPREGESQPHTPCPLQPLAPAGRS